MTPREALDDLLGRVPVAQSQHSEPARLVLEQSVTALGESEDALKAARAEIARVGAELTTAETKLLLHATNVPPSDPPQS